MPCGRRYAAFLGMLEAASTDNLDFLKDKALKAAAALLAAKPEGEARLLSILVNKLGDPSRKLASKVRPRGRRVGPLLHHGAWCPVKPRVYSWQCLSRRLVHPSAG